MQGFLWLGLAIVSEVIGSNALKASEGFSKLGPSLLMVVCYIAAFSFLSLTLKELSLGMSYAIWAGVGTAGTAVLSWLYWKEPFNPWAAFGIGLIIVGVVILNLFSQSHAA